MHCTFSINEAIVTNTALEQLSLRFGLFTKENPKSDSQINALQWVMVKVRLQNNRQSISHLEAKLPFTAKGGVSCRQLLQVSVPSPPCWGQRYLGHDGKDLFIDVSWGMIVWHWHCLPGGMAGLYSWVIRWLGRGKTL